jgi:hypothetical protein
MTFVLSAVTSTSLLEFSLDGICHGCKWLGLHDHTMHGLINNKNNIYTNLNLKSLFGAQFGYFSVRQPTCTCTCRSVYTPCLCVLLMTIHVQCTICHVLFWYSYTCTPTLRYHHRNILSLVAYSNDGPTPCLVYEYMENGSLADCFQGKVQKYYISTELCQHTCTCVD